MKKFNFGGIAYLLPALVVGVQAAISNWNTNPRSGTMLSSINPARNLP
jgi:hypothetical protein